MADCGQVRADLVRAPGFEAYAQQRGVRQLLLELEMRARLARPVGPGRDDSSLTSIAPDRGVDRPPPGVRPALDQRQVLAPDLARLDLVLQRAVGLLVLGDHQQARGI